MAYIEERNRSNASPVWRVIWREGKDRHSETFKVYEKAIEFTAHVDASGQRCPPGWTPGYDWPGTFTPPLPAPVEGERSITTAAFVLASAGRRPLKRPSTRVLMAMDSNGVVHGVGTYGSITLTLDGDGMTAVMRSNGQRDDWTATPDPTTSGQSAKALPFQTTQTCVAWTFCPYAASGPTVQLMF